MTTYYTRAADTNIQLNTTKIFYAPTYNINFIRYIVSVVSVVCVCNKMHNKIYRYRVHHNCNCSCIGPVRHFKVLKLFNLDSITVIMKYMPIAMSSYKRIA